jgi:hypothetical protein
MTAVVEAATRSETYSRRIGKRLNWRVQLNIRNLFDDQDPVSQRANLGQGFCHHLYRARAEKLHPDQHVFVLNVLAAQKPGSTLSI